VPSHDHALHQSRIADGIATGPLPSLALLRLTLVWLSLASLPAAHSRLGLELRLHLFLVVGKAGLIVN
jgi:hypothetical protein